VQRCRRPDQNGAAHLMRGTSSAAERALGPDPLDVVIIAESADPAEAPMVLERTACIHEGLSRPPRCRASSPALWAWFCRTQDPPMNSGSVAGKNSQVLTIGVFAPEAAVVQDHLLTCNVVAEAPAAQPQPVLPIAAPYPGKFFDVVLPRPVVGITAENLEGLILARSKLRITLEETARQALIVGCGAHRKCWRHDFFWRRPVDFPSPSALNSAKNSSAGRLFPARYSC
jgi:hypothetical protein